MKRIILSLLAGLLIGALAAWYFMPPKVVEKVVTKTDVVTKIKRIKSPDGTVVTEVEKVDHSTHSDTKVTPLKPSPQWHISVMAPIEFPTLQITPENILVSVERRIMGPVFVGAYGGLDTIGLSVGVNF